MHNVLTDSNGDSLARGKAASRNRRAQRGATSQAHLGIKLKLCGMTSMELVVKHDGGGDGGLRPAGEPARDTVQWF